MTKSDKPTTRETYSSYRGRPIVLTVAATYVKVRLKGMRKSFALDAVAIYQLACKAEAEQVRRLKRANKGGK